jgi:hypothetical protein
MNFTPTECRAIEQRSAEDLNLLMDQLRAFYECQKQLEHVEGAVSGDATHQPSNANRALTLIEKARNDLNTALALVVGVRLRQMDGRM